VVDSALTTKLGYWRSSTILWLYISIRTAEYTPYNKKQIWSKLSIQIQIGDAGEYWW